MKLLKFNENILSFHHHSHYNLSLCSINVWHHQILLTIRFPPLSLGCAGSAHCFQTFSRCSTSQRTYAPPTGCTHSRIACPGPAQWVCMLASPITRLLNHLWSNILSSIHMHSHNFLRTFHSYISLEYLINIYQIIILHSKYRWTYHNLLFCNWLN